MTEKDMVMDVLSGVKASIGTYAKVITECSDPQLRAMFQQMRDGDEKFQYDLYKIAEQKGYYTCAPKADQAQVQNIKSTLTQASSQTTPQTQRQPVGMGMR